MSLLKRKKLVPPLAAVAVLAVAAAAFAYWTTSGSGTGSAATGTSTAVTISQVGSVAGLVPGGAAQPVDFKITNPKSTPQYVASVAVSISGVSGPNIDATHPCSASDFTLVQPTAISADLPAGDSAFSPSGATIAMKDTGSNQDGCKGASVSLAFNAS